MAIYSQEYWSCSLLHYVRQEGSNTSIPALPPPQPQGPQIISSKNPWKYTNSQVICTFIIDYYNWICFNISFSVKSQVTVQRFACTLFITSLSKNDKRERHLKGRNALVVLENDLEWDMVGSLPVGAATFTPFLCRQLFIYIHVEWQCFYYSIISPPWSRT